MPHQEDDNVGGSMEADQHWKVSKQIPLALILVIIGQTFGAAWWAASLSGRVDVLEKQMVVSAPLSERMVKIETKLDVFAETMTEIKNLLRQVPTRSEPRAP